MPLTLLLLLVIGGIAGIAALTWAFGMGRAATIPDTDTLRRLWDADNPGDPARAAHLAESGRSGLVVTDTGTGLVWPMGADHATRRLDGATLHRGRRGYVMHLPDYTAPRVALHLTNAEAEAWVDRMERGTAWQGHD